MAGTSIPSKDPVPTAPPVKRTRRTDVWTDLFLVITAVFGLWAATLIVLTSVAIIRPTFLYSDWKVALKAVGATAVAALALFQAFTMGAAMGTFPRFGHWPTTPPRGRGAPRRSRSSSSG
jgi:hypothetical protein